MAERTYRAAPPGALRIEPLGELTALFDRRSMQTHLVAPPIPEILAAMGEEACTAPMLTARLAARFDLGGAGEAEALVAAHLGELATMGLVERV